MWYYGGIIFFLFFKVTGGSLQESKDALAIAETDGQVH